MPRDDRTTPRLRLICVGTGRDGTQSLTHMLRDVLEQIGAGQTVAHEYASREFFEAFTESKELDHASGAAWARRLIETCPYDIIVGNGYAPWLPLFAEVCGPKARLVHLRRLDRGACIRSLVENAEMFPTAYGNYNDGKLSITNRPTAWHFGDMTKQDWGQLSLKDKLGWYYDKTHALIHQYAPLFSASFNIYTEHLSSEATLHLIGELAAGQAPRANPMHLNSHVDVPALASDVRHKVQWLIGRLDLHRVAHDDTYPLRYITNEYIAWTGYQIRRSEHIGPEDFRTREQLASSLKGAAELLEKTHGLVRQLEADLQRADFDDDPDLEPSPHEIVTAPSELSEASAQDDADRGDDRESASDQLDEVPVLLRKTPYRTPDIEDRKDAAMDDPSLSHRSSERV